MRSILITPKQILLFIFFSLLVFSVIPKTTGILVFNESTNSEFNLPSFVGTNRLTNSTRFGGILIGFSIEKTMIAIGDNLSVFRDNGKNSLETTSTSKLYNSMSSILYRYVVLIPIFIISIRWIPSTFTGGLFILFVIASIGGFGAAHDFLAKTLYFIIFPNHFHHFFDLRESTYYVDFIAIGFFPIAAMALEQGTHKILLLAILTVLGQFCYEHFGFVVGVAAACHAVLHYPEISPAQRLKRATILLALCGALSILVVASLLLPGILSSGELVFVGNKGTGWEGFIAEAAPNRANWKHVLVRLAYMLAPACLSGVLVGTLGVFLCKSLSAEQIIARLHALVSLLIGFIGAVLIGFLALTNFSSEMGREFLQIQPVLFLLFFYLPFWIKIRKTIPAR